MTKGLVMAEPREPNRTPVPAISREPNEPSLGMREPRETAEKKQESKAGNVVSGSAMASAVGVDLAADLAGISKRAIQKAIHVGRLQATQKMTVTGPNKGRLEFEIGIEALGSLYPQAKERWEARQAEERRNQEARMVQPPASLFKRDAQEVFLRAKPDSMTHAQAAMNARLRFLSVLQAALRDVPEIERRRGIPSQIVTDAIAWLVGSQDGKKLLAQLGKIPSSGTLLRWWRAFCADPTGLSLQPKHYAAGRDRLIDKDPALMNEILAAMAVAKSFKGTANILRQAGYEISANTVGRVLAQVPQSVLAAPVKGERKALHDYGPYVRRRASLPFQCWSIDGHTWDAETLWERPGPGEKIQAFRPHLYVVRDVGSGAILACQIGGTGLNRYLALQAIAEAILRWGVIPETIQPDNGSEVRNRLFEGDEADIIGYWDQLGMDWKDGTALVHYALPYNSRSKPVERDFRIFTERFAAQLPGYVGNSPSRRPGAPLDEAMRAGDLETVPSLRAKLYAWLNEWNGTDRTIQRHRINPNRALLEQKDNLIQELGADHPRFIRPGQEWRILPSLKARKVRELIHCRIEGKEFRYYSSILVGLEVEDLTVRINPWDMTQAWLCRGGELLDILEFIPDGSALGDEIRDVVALRRVNNIKSQLKTVIRNAKNRADAIQTEADMRGFRLDHKLVATLEEKARPVDIDPAELERQRQQMAQEEQKARQRPEDPVDRYRRLLLLTDPAGLTEADRQWIQEFEKTSEGKSLKELLKDYRRDGGR